MFDFKEYAKVFIGIGEEFSVKIPENIGNQWDELRFLKQNVDLKSNIKTSNLFYKK